VLPLEEEVVELDFVVEEQKHPGLEGAVYWHAYCSSPEL
jgi:hypothetical protein